MVPRGVTIVLAAAAFVAAADLAARVALGHELLAFAARPPAPAAPPPPPPPAPEPDSVVPQVPRMSDARLLRIGCNGGGVTVTAVAPWHVNDKAPWKWDHGSKRALDQREATFTGDSCTGTVKAFICSGDWCKGPIAIAVE